jgi:leucine dehydrogenase
MLEIRELTLPGYQRVIEAIDPECKLHAFIAVHSTTLGPSLGGMRMYPYKSRDDALQDALRLAKTMTYKSALAKTGLGGGKSVLIGNPKIDKTEALLLSFAAALNHLEGDYIAAEDMGITAEDLLIVKKISPYVAALPTPGSSGDPSRFTAFGVYRGILAVAKRLWNSDNLQGKKIAIQGLGNVGIKLARFLFWSGADLLLSDLDDQKVESACRELGAIKVDPKEVVTASCDIFSPCAMGGIITKENIPLLKCKAIAGSTNNQLENPKDEILLMKQGILYAPDYVINAGGILNAACEFLPEGYSPLVARAKTADIYHTLIKIFETAQKENAPPTSIADQMAEAVLYIK